MIHLMLLALAPTFFVMLLGYGAGRTGHIDNMHVAGLNTVVMSYCLPASLLVATASTRWPELAAQWPILLSLAVAMMGVYLAWYAYQRTVRKQGSSESALEALAVGQPNFAAAAFPVITALFGVEHLSTIAVGVAVGSLLPSPLTLALLELDAAGAGAENGHAGAPDARNRRRRTAGGRRWRPIAKAALHALSKPIVLAPILGVLISLSGWRLPDAAAAALREIGTASGGLGLLVTGLVLSESRFQLTLNTALGAGVANIVQPVLAFLVCRAVAAPADITRLSVVMAALPSGFFGILFGASYGRLSRDANSIIIASTLSSALTLLATVAWTYRYGR